ncbi:hypothetical protein ACTXT7_014887 [Hymenolepis weldensis]
MRVLESELPFHCFPQLKIVRQYRKRQYRRVISTTSFRDNESTSTATTTHVGGQTRAKEVHLPPTAATWSVALCRTEASVAKAVASAAQMVASTSVGSLTFTVYGSEDTENANKPFLFCFGLFKCTPRRMRIFLYLGSLLTVIISIELALYIWAMTLKGRKAASSSQRTLIWPLCHNNVPSADACSPPF